MLSSDLSIVITSYILEAPPPYNVYDTIEWVCYVILNVRYSLYKNIMSTNVEPKQINEINYTITARFGQVTVRLVSVIG